MKNKSIEMSNIRTKDTLPELIVRRYLHKKGLRYRLHRKDLPGNPDIVLKKYNSVIFVHGCFWHQHNGCKKSRRPKTNIDFWNKKLDRNIQRDDEAVKKLKEIGWNVFIIWECQVGNSKELSKLHQSIYKNKTSISKYF